MSGVKPKFIPKQKAVKKEPVEEPGSTSEKTAASGSKSVKDAGSGSGSSDSTRKRSSGRNNSSSGGRGGGRGGSGGGGRALGGVGALIGFVTARKFAIAQLVEGYAFFVVTAQEIVIIKVIPVAVVPAAKTVPVAKVDGRFE